MAKPMPATCHDIEVSSGRVSALYRHGRRSPVVLIHGNSASKDIFASQIVALGNAGFGVVAIDLPGHGLSDDARDPSEDYSFPGYARVAAEVLDAFCIEGAHVVGWSLGGHIGLELMGQDTRVKSLFICGTPPAKPCMASLTEAFLPSAAMTYASQHVLSDADCMAYALAMTGTQESPAGPIVRDIRRADGKARVWMFKNAISGVGLDQRALVETDPRPLAVLHGADDPFISLAYLQRIAYRNLWRDEVQVFHGVGHAAQWQAPDAFNALLLSFLLSFPEEQAL